MYIRIPKDIVTEQLQGCNELSLKPAECNKRKKSTEYSAVSFTTVLARTLLKQS